MLKKNSFFNQKYQDHLGFLVILNINVKNSGK